ncbi:hypothetical protein PV04_07061 [Phialophora macrospora]|uniref:Zn(2)-C6 fungal-type domain-containing protein n=1 Tax=Phialophora macrospora TaxID=1851006 RepID=A0A0D2E0E6_9EURO|nr:hypothetical protein PV04_07061 [Phialophora macrospora]
MEGEPAFAGLGNSAARGAASAPIIHFCSLCNKPFTNESARDRHSRYCTTRTRKRPRSCQSCNAAKIKCSFETPCLRCAKKGIVCIYNHSKARPPHGEALAAATPGIMAPSRLLGNPNGSFDREGTLVVGAAASSPANLELVRNNAMLNTKDLAPEEDSYQLFDFNTQESLFNDSFTIDGMFAADPDTLIPDHCLADVSVTPYGKSDCRLKDWCSWSSHGLSLAVVSEASPALPGPGVGVLAGLWIECSQAQRSADLIVQSLRAFPTMMLRRETLPWFIHPQSQLMSKSGSGAAAALPDAISTCMGIAQIFIARTPETKPFLWRIIRGEYRRLLNEMHNMSKFDALLATQACMIYLVMCIIDYSSENERHGQELLRALYDLCVYFKELAGGHGAGNGSESELANPSHTWEDWIFAESRRRLSSLWLLIGCVVCVKTGVACDPSGSYRSIPLPGPKSLWEASTQSAWELEYEASRMLHVRGPVTLGDLVALQRSAYTPSNAGKLDVWNARVDNLGSLLNLVHTMI